MYALAHQFGGDNWAGSGRAADAVTPALQLESISKRFGQNVAVQDASFAISAGETIALLGPSGCGKTTTLRIIAGFVEPTSGRVRMYGRDMGGIAPNRRNVGVVFQDFALFPHLSVLENVAFGPRHRGMTKGQAHERARQFLKLVRLEKFEDRLPRTLSGGQQQRVALARALATTPEVLLLDEPLSALDAKLRVHLRQEIKAILREVRISTIIVTHDQEEAMSMADRVLVMNEGFVLQDGTPQSLYQRPQHPFVADFVGKANWIDGRIKRIGPDLVFVSGDQMQFVIPADFVEGDARAMIRPEAIRLARVPGQDGASLIWLPVTVTDQSFLGQDVELHVRTSTGSRFVVLVRGIDKVTDTQLHIGIDPAHLIVFPKNELQRDVGEAHSQ